MCDDDRELIYTLSIAPVIFIYDCPPRFPIVVSAPTVAVCAVKSLAIVRELWHAGVVVGERGNIVATRKHPQRFVQMEERVSVTSSVEQHTLTRLLVGDDNRFFDHHHFAVP